MLCKMEKFDEKFDESKIKCELYQQIMQWLGQMKNKLEKANSLVEYWKDWNIELKAVTNANINEKNEKKDFKRNQKLCRYK